MSNLKPFKKGQTGNPNGRPRKIPLDELLKEVCTKDEMLAVLKALIRKAKIGNTTAIQILFDRYYGKSKNYVEVNEVEKDVSFDLSNLTQTELETFLELQQKIHGFTT